MALVQNRLYDRRGTLICSRIKSIPFCVLHCIVPFFRRVCSYILFDRCIIYISQKFENHRCVSWNVKIEKKKKKIRISLQLQVFLLVHFFKIYIHHKIIKYLLSPPLFLCPNLQIALRLIKYSSLKNLIISNARILSLIIS